MNLKPLRLALVENVNIKAGDITLTQNVEILNPDHHIATLAEGAKIEMEMTVEMGRGYEAVEKRGELQTTIGVIPIDALFSPVRKVNYAVTNSRVGRRTDFQRLTLEVWTNGTILPEDAVAYAAKIVKNQLTIFINFDESEIDEVPESEDVQEIKGTEEILFNTIEEMDLSARSLNCLRKAGIEYAGDLTTKNRRRSS